MNFYLLLSFLFYFTIKMFMKMNLFTKFLYLKVGVKYFTYLAKSEDFLKYYPEYSKFFDDKESNLPLNILKLSSKKLWKNQNHPIFIIKNEIEEYLKKLKSEEFKENEDYDPFSIFDDLPHIVSVYQNFDSLLFKKDHPSRTKSQTYYISQNYLMQAHTSAHQVELMSKGIKSFLIFGSIKRQCFPKR